MPKTLKELVKEAATNTIEGHVTEVIRVVEEAYRLGLENGHDAADGAPESPTIESSVLELCDIVSQLIVKVETLEGAK